MIPITASEAKFLTDIAQKQWEKEFLEDIYKGIKDAALKGDNSLYIKNKRYIDTSRIENDLKDLGFSVRTESDEYFDFLKIKW